MKPPRTLSEWRFAPAAARRIPIVFACAASAGRRSWWHCRRRRCGRRSRSSSRDLKGSTTLGERLDSESLREVMTRYFEEMRGALEEHGGRVEKYIGDAVMAVFGMPRTREDDALRAVRAAAEMKRRLAVVNDGARGPLGGHAGEPDGREHRGGGGRRPDRRAAARRRRHGQRRRAARAGGDRERGADRRADVPARPRQRSRSSRSSRSS